MKITLVMAYALLYNASMESNSRNVRTLQDGNYAG